MVISKNSELGLMSWDRDMMLEYSEHCRKLIDRELIYVKGLVGDKKINIESNELGYAQKDSAILWKEICSSLGYKKENTGSEFYTIKHPKPHLYLIQPSVHTCADKIRIKEGFTCSIFNKIKDGEHVYLLGKQEMFRFIKFNGVIKGMFWNRDKKLAFEIGFHLLKDRWYSPSCEIKEFNRLVRLMTFVELGDIEIVVLEKGRNNGKPKNDGKITNTSDYCVYVVDSSWNKIVIRTEGFAVSGHYRLQPCGQNMSDRKLIWISAFEKHGYIRRPRAQIID